MKTMNDTGFPAALLAILLLLAAGPIHAKITFDWVRIGDPGNPAQSPANRDHNDSAGDGRGSVSYEYRIARDEVTIGQYVEFLNAVASSADPYNLYKDAMGSYEQTAGVARSEKQGGGWVYAAIGSVDRPIAWVSWFDAARFVNWIHNGQKTGAEAALSAESGVYPLHGATSGYFAAPRDAPVRLPTLDEWYKAAYYDPAKNDATGGYWLYPMRCDEAGGNLIGAAHAANCVVVTEHGYVWAKDSNGLPSYLTPVGAYGGASQSHYGTNDQGGNLGEWNDQAVHAVGGWMRGFAGGYWCDTELYMRSSSCNTVYGHMYGDMTGFRVAGGLQTFSHFARLSVDGDPSDWETAPDYPDSCSAEGIPAIHSVKVANDDDNLYLLIRYEGTVDTDPLNGAPNLYLSIDKDADPGSGYDIGGRGVIGAELSFKGDLPLAMDRERPRIPADFGPQAPIRIVPYHQRMEWQEYAIARNACYSVEGGGLRKLFPQEEISFALWSDHPQQPAFVGVFKYRFAENPEPGNDPLLIWKTKNFTPEELDDPEISGDAADPDGDGIANLLEFALGGNPKHADPGTLPRTTLEDGVFGVGYRVRTVPRLWVWPEYSSDLVEWTADPDAFRLISRTEAVIKGMQDIRIAPVSEGERGFIRFNAVYAPRGEAAKN